MRYIIFMVCIIAPAYCMQQTPNETLYNDTIFPLDEDQPIDLSRYTFSEYDHSTSYTPTRDLSTTLHCDTLFPLDEEQPIDFSSYSCTPDNYDQNEMGEYDDSCEHTSDEDSDFDEDHTSQEYSRELSKQQQNNVTSSHDHTEMAMTTRSRRARHQNAIVQSIKSASSLSYQEHKTIPQPTSHSTQGNPKTFNKKRKRTKTSPQTSKNLTASTSTQQKKKVNHNKKRRNKERHDIITSDLATHNYRTYNNENANYITIEFTDRTETPQHEIRFTCVQTQTEHKYIAYCPLCSKPRQSLKHPTHAQRHVSRHENKDHTHKWAYECKKCQLRFLDPTLISDHIKRTCTGN